MNDEIGAHGCISYSMSGTVRSGIGYTKLNEICPRCGEKIIEKYFHKVTLRPIESAQDASPAAEERK